MVSKYITDVINRIKAGIEKDGEYNLLLIDQMALAKGGVDIQALCLEENWMPEHGAVESVKIRKVPDGQEYNAVLEEDTEDFGGEFVVTNHWE